MRAMPRPLPRRRALLAPLRLSVLAALTFGGAHVAHAQTTTTPPAQDDPEAAAKPPPPGGASDPEAAQGAQGDDAEARAQQDAHKTAPDESAADEGHADEKESKRAVYMAFNLGFVRADVGGITNDLGFDKTGANGLTYAFAAGLRLRDFRFGGRFQTYSTTEFDLWSFMFEVGYGLPIRPLSPSLYARVGYVWDHRIQPAMIRSSLPPGNVLPPQVDLRGVVVGVEAVGSYWVTKFLRIGPYVGGDLFVLSRPTVDVPRSILGDVPQEIRERPLYNEAGTGLGYALSIGFRGSFDIGF
jgi:hypothetical protein